MSMRYLAGFVSAFYNPLKVADAPTIGMASAGNSQISITFTAPSNIGGGAITGYIATAKKTFDSTTVSATGASSPITITGLTNGSAYTVTVAAVNSFGPSASSAASSSVSPVAPPTVIGQAFGGGYYAGQIGVSSVATHYLIVGPVSSAQASNISWKTSNTITAGTESVIDGPANSTAMNNASHPAAQFCKAVTAGGFSDWYMPAQNELEVCYYNLKPTTQNNYVGTLGGNVVGVNPNAVPARASGYTTGTPSQTSAAAFQSSGAEAFTSGPNTNDATYWSSTQRAAPYGANYAMTIRFQDGVLIYRQKFNPIYKARAVRRVAV